MAQYNVTFQTHLNPDEVSAALYEIEVDSDFDLFFDPIHENVEGWYCFIVDHDLADEEHIEEALLARVPCVELSIVDEGGI